MQFAIGRDDVLATIGNQKLIEEGVAITAIRGHLETEGIDVAHALLAQLFLHALEEIIVSVPVLRDVLHLVTGLLDQRPPDVVEKHIDRIGYAVKAAFLLNVVVAADRQQRGIGVFLPLGLDDIGYV